MLFYTGFTLLLEAMKQKT